MNKNFIIGVGAGLFALILLGGTAIILFRPDASATFIALVVQVLAVGVSAVGTLYGLGKVKENTETIKKNTNGTLSALVAHATGKSELTPEELASIAARIETDNG